MAQRKPAKIIKLRVPKHNSQRLNPKLSTEVKSIARKQKIRIDTYQQESSSALAQAVVRSSRIFNGFDILTYIPGECFRLEFSLDDCSC